MKPAAFELRTPGTLADALADLADCGDDGRALAGGQSLIPLLNFRMAQPLVLVDLGDVEELRYIRRSPDGGLVIGAMTTQTELLESAVVAESHPIVARTVGHVAHEPIRNRGTLGGSLAHLDPAAEMPALALVLDAELVLASSAGQRVVPVGEFIQGPYTSALEEGELLTEVRLPPVPFGTRVAMDEVAQRAGDFAVAGALGLLELDGEGTVRELRVVAFGASARPTRLSEVEVEATGRPVDDELIAAVADGYARGITAMDDRSGPAAYRRHLTRVMVTRVLREAGERPATSA